MSETPQPPAEPQKDQSEIAEKAADLQVKAGLLKLEDVPADQRNEAVAKYLSQVNAQFEARQQTVDPEAVRKLILKQYGQLGLDDLKDIANHTEDIVALASDTNNDGAADANPVDGKPTSEATTEPGAAGTDVSGKQSAETIEADPARQTRLKEFVATHFADVCPPEFYNQAATICQEFEDELRELMEMPDLEIEAADVDDTLKQEVVGRLPVVAENTETMTDQATEIAALEAENETVSAESDKAEADAELIAPELEATQAERADTKAQLTAEQARDTELRAEQSEAQADQRELKNEKKSVDRREDQSEVRNDQLEETADLKEAEEEATAEDLKTVKELQAKFDSLKAEKGTIGALKSLLGPKGVKTPKMKAIVQRVLGTAQSLVAALPGKAAVVERFLNQSNVNLSAQAPVQTFAGFLALADQSNELTEEEKTQLREILHSSANVDTASDLKSAIAQGRGVRQLEDGTTEIIPYDAEHPLDHGDGLKSYPKGDELIIEADGAGKRLKFKASLDTPSSDLTERIANYMVLQEASFMGLTDASDMGVVVAQGGGTIDLNTVGGNDRSTQFAEQIRKEFLTESYRGARFPNEQERGLLRHHLQWLLPVDGSGGDGGARDNSVARQQQCLGGGGQDGLLFTKDGALKEAEFQKAAHFIRSQYGAGDPNFEDLQAHLLNSEAADTLAA